jgi:O-antigen ligase
VIEPSVLPRLFLMSDRFDIASIGLGLLFERPLFGYGGLTLDQVIKTGSYSHLHNWFLEILFRYGSLGLMMFLLFFYSVWQRVKSRDDKFMMLVLLFLAFFQIYIRNFVFLMFLLYLENHETAPHVQEK